MGRVSSVVIAGCGYVGQALAVRLGERAFGVRRSALPAGTRGIAADLRDRGALVAGLPADAVALVYLASPDGGDDAAYHAAYLEGLATVAAALREIGAPIARAIVTTSTAVYAEDAGWVDEESPTARGGRASVLLDAESLAASTFETAIALRLAGIYGPGRDRIVRSVLEGTARMPREARYGNRIHRDDAAGAIERLLGIPGPAPVYLGVDDDPADMREVYGWLARELGVARPGLEDEGEGSRAAARGTRKRCRNARLRATAWVPAFPSYREGYLDALRGALRARPS